MKWKQSTQKRHKGDIIVMTLICFLYGIQGALPRIYRIVHDKKKCPVRWPKARSETSESVGIISLYHRPTVPGLVRSSLMFSKAVPLGSSTVCSHSRATLSQNTLLNISPEIIIVCEQISTAPHSHAWWREPADWISKGSESTYHLWK